MKSEMNSNQNILQIFDSLINSSNVKSLLNCYKLLNDLNQGFLKDEIQSFNYFLKLKKLIFQQKSLQKWVKIIAILQKLEKRSKEKYYLNNNKLINKRVLVIGGGISGLRVSIELLLLGAKVICVEKRDKFSRNNVIHLWPNVITDLKGLGAKRFYGKFCMGSIDHISIRQIQLILLKIALIYGLKFMPNQAFDNLCPNLMQINDNQCLNNNQNNFDLCKCCCHSHGFGGGAKAHFHSTNGSMDSMELEKESFDIIIGSDGRRNTLNKDFPRKEFRGKLAIAITVNFINNKTEKEVRVPEISGVSYIYNQKWFKSLLEETGIQLENICYYRDETHYFVMTATKQSLLSRSVLCQDFSETHLLLNDSNINREQLLRYAKDAAQWTSGLEDLEFAQNASHSADVALFDFTSVYASRNASRAKQIYLDCCQKTCDQKTRHTKYVLMMLCGDSLLEPFWPTGSGAGRGFLSAIDAAYCALQWTLKVRDNNDYEEMVDVIAERESIYRLLAQTTPENINIKEYSLLPSIRYQNWRPNMKFEIRNQIKSLIGNQSIIDESIAIKEQQSSLLAIKRARRATVAVTTRDFVEQEKRVENNINNRYVDNRLEIKVKIPLNQKTEEEREEEKEEQIETNNRIIRQKADWLLGSSTSDSINTDIDYRQSREKSEAIQERAKQLDRILIEMNESFQPKLQKVGKIEENDWNFRVWNQNTIFEPKNNEKKPKIVSKEILKSRVNQLENKMNEKEKKSSELATDLKVKSRKDWIKKMSEELQKRMNENNPLVYDQQLMSVPPCSTSSSSSSSTLRPKCVRCQQDVNAMERISVSGEILHRSCLRCSKCGISLRLNEFRNELKFLCIYCLKNNNFKQGIKGQQEGSTQGQSSLKAKEMFLEKVEKIDFRERIEFKNELIEHGESDSESSNDEDEDILTTSDNNDADDDDSDWETTEMTASDEQETETEDDESEDQRDDNIRNETTNQIVLPSIYISESNNNKTVGSGGHKYSGQFTEKLFRSRSQPILFHFKNNNKLIVNQENDQLLDDDEHDEHGDLVPFADNNEINNFCQLFSPLKGLKAPVVVFEDI